MSEGQKLAGVVDAALAGLPRARFARGHAITAGYRALYGDVDAAVVCTNPRRAEEGTGLEQSVLQACFRRLKEKLGAKYTIELHNTGEPGSSCAEPSAPHIHIK